jgi:hypothetical protein
MRPIVRRHEPADARGIIAGFEILQSALRVVLFAGESVVLRHDRTVVLLNAAVRIIVDVLLTRR